MADRLTCHSTRMKISRILDPTSHSSGFAGGRGEDHERTCCNPQAQKDRTDSCALVPTLTLMFVCLTSRRLPQVKLRTRCRISDHSPHVLVFYTPDVFTGLDWS